MNVGDCVDRILENDGAHSVQGECGFIPQCNPTGEIGVRGISGVAGVLPGLDIGIYIGVSPISHLVSHSFAE